jgi:methylmalonyl-CoA/ethylmalonyl-CoA epimerase
MGDKVFGNTTLTQVGIVVRDIEKTSKAYAAAFGIEAPAWSWTDSFEEARTEYRGEPTRARSKLAFMRFGSLDIELIEPDEGPSTWREFLDERGEGVHHIAFEIAGMKAQVAGAAAAGMPLLQKGEYSGGRYAYVDASAELKVVVELLENDAARDEAR